MKCGLVARYRLGEGACDQKWKRKMLALNVSQDDGHLDFVALGRPCGKINILIMSNKIK